MQEVVHVVIGVPWEPAEFIKQASDVVHPYDRQPAVPEQLCHNQVTKMLGPIWTLSTRFPLMQKVSTDR